MRSVQGLVALAIFAGLIWVSLRVACKEDRLGKQQLRRFVMEVGDQKAKVGFDYLLYLPRGYNQDKRAWPLVLFLHGTGDKIEQLKKYGLPQLVEENRSCPFVMVTPHNSELVWKPQLLQGLLDEIESKYRVDPDRVYVTGRSMGGYGTWSLAADCPHRFAAIVPICGGGDPLTVAKTLKDLPIWVFHGAKDEIVPLRNSEMLVKALSDAGSNKVKFTVYPEGGHDVWSAAYNNQALWDWLLTQKRVGGQTN